MKMAVMKKTVSLFLTLVLLLSFSGTVVYAEKEETAALQDLTDGVVTNFHYERSFLYFENKISTYHKDDLAELYDILKGIEDVLDCTVRLPDGEEVEEMCTVVWNTADIPLDTAGSYTVIATLIPPQGGTFGDGVRTEIRLPVQILDDETPVKIVSVEEWNPYLIAVAVERGSTVEDVAEEAIFVDCTTEAISAVDENGGEHLLDINWDFSPINLNKTGTYTITGTIVPQNGTEFVQDIKLPVPTATVSVQEKGNPDINCFFVWFPSVYLPWISTQESSKTATVWMSENEGGWQQLIPDEQVNVNQYNVCIDLDMFTKGKNYRVQVDYEGGQTGILSFSWDDTIVIEGYHEGDRDGGDSDGNKPPNITQPPPKPDDNAVPPAPIPPQMPKPELPSSTVPEADSASPNGSGEQDGTSNITPLQNTVESIPQSDKNHSSDFLEHSDETSTTISGLRLHLMRKDGSVLFSKQGVNVVLSKEAIDDLSLTDDSVFTIEIKRESENIFSFAVMVDGIEITGLAGTKVTLPYTPGGTESTLSVRHSRLKTETPGSYEPKPQLASFVLDTSGQYTILEEDVPAAVKHDSSEQVKQTEHARLPNLPIFFTASVLLLLSGGIFFLKIRYAK